MVRHGGHDPNAAPGSAASYLCLGPGFSNACNTPFRRHKTWVHEGGISTPLVVHWPNGIKSRNEIRNTPGHVIDILPTILDVAGIKRPTTMGGEALPESPGKSLVPAFDQDVVIQRDHLWWMHEDNFAVRVGDWKLVSANRDRDPNSPHKPRWELYNLASDRAEQKNLASQFPDKVAQLETVWQTEYDHIRQTIGPYMKQRKKK